jgi:hypothetical protein
VNSFNTVVCRLLVTLASLVAFARDAATPLFARTLAVTLAAGVVARAERVLLVWDGEVFEAHYGSGQLAPEVQDLTAASDRLAALRAEVRDLAVSLPREAVSVGLARTAAPANDIAA